jgi:hypothetical protein
MSRTEEFAVAMIFLAAVAAALHMIMSDRK